MQPIFTNYLMTSLACTSNTTSAPRVNLSNGDKSYLTKSTISRNSLTNIYRNPVNPPCVLSLSLIEASLPLVHLIILTAKTI